MQVPHDQWHVVSASCPPYLRMRNGGQCALAYLLTARKPPQVFEPIDTETQYVLGPDASPIVLLGLQEHGIYVYARAIGPVAGYLEISTEQGGVLHA